MKTIQTRFRPFHHILLNCCLGPGLFDFGPTVKAITMPDHFHIYGSARVSPY